MISLPRFDTMRDAIDSLRAKHKNAKRFLNAVKNSYHGRDSFYSEHAMNYANALLTEGLEK